MVDPSLHQLLEDVARGATSPAAALERLRGLPFADLGFARVDHHRPLRQGFPEAVYAPGKTPAQCAAIVAELAAGPTAGPVLLTRAGEDVAAAALARTPGGRYDPVARLAVWNPLPRRTGSAVVACAGTADLPVAEEAATTLAALGWPPARLTDVGVAGIHRLLAEEPVLQAADVIVVVAGMEGAPTDDDRRLVPLLRRHRRRHGPRRLPRRRRPPRRGDRHPRAAADHRLGSGGRARHAGRAGRHQGPREGQGRRHHPHLRQHRRD